MRREEQAVVMVYAEVRDRDEQRRQAETLSAVLSAAFGGVKKKKSDG